jgi:predicted ATP-grasp superfamily ATP-dependent carboligase
VHIRQPEINGRKTLVIGISVRAVVESAVRSNCPVIALDAFGDQDLKTLAESYALPRDFHVSYSPRSLYEAGRRLKFDSVAYTSNLENHPEVLDLFAASYRIIGNSPQAVRSVRCWPDLFSRLEHAGFPVPETIYAPTDHELDLTRRWLVKPLLSGGGHGVHCFRKRSFSAKRSMVQQYIPGKAGSASFIANGVESVLIGITEQLVGVEQFGAQGFRYCGSMLPLPEILAPETGKAVIDQARRISDFLTRSYGLTGVNGFDFILDGDQVCLIEVNPRYSASMELIERAYGLPIYVHHVQAALDRLLPEFKLETQLNRGKFFGKSILFCEMESIVPGTFAHTDLDLRDIPSPGEKLHEGSPVCTLLASRETYAETFAELVRQSGKMKEQIYG